jgi:hypothetical protein
VDERLAPLFAIDAGGGGAGFAAPAGGFKSGLHLGDKRFAFGLGFDNCGDQADVFVDICKSVRSKRQNRKAGFQNRREGFHAIGHAGEDEAG